MKFNLHQKNFFIGLLVWMMLVSLGAFCFPKLTSFSVINFNNHPVLDVFFGVITHVGDGIFIVTLAFALFFLRHRILGIAILSTYILSGAICVSLKRFFHVPRPASFLANDPDFNSLSWLPLAYHNSFPSGHTTSVFAMVTTIALFSKNKIIAHIVLLMACLTAYSRVYLGQHFVEDLWLGTVLGCVVPMICYRLYIFWEEKLHISRVQIPSLHI